MALPPEAIALLGVPPPRFTAARAEVARALAERGDPAAAAVRKLRRPVGVAWVLNRLSRDHPGEVRALLEAGDRLRAGQRRAVSGAGGEALRAAEAAVRERARALRLEAERLLAAEGRPADGTTLARIELLLRVAASGPARDALAAGTLAREPEVGDAGLSGLTLVAGGTAAPSPAETRPRAPGRQDRGTRLGATRSAARAAPTERRRSPAAAAPPQDEAKRSAQEARAREAREREARRQAARDARDAARRRKEHARAAAAAHAAAAKASERAEREERAAEQAEQRAREARERAAKARANANRAAARALEVERTGQ